MDNFWKHYDFRLEPWGVDYDTPVRFSADETLSDVAIELDVEQADWSACSAPKSTSLPERLLFVDGRRRVDARFLGRNGNELIMGAFGTVAVGGVLVDRVKCEAWCHSAFVRRVVATGGQCLAPQVRIDSPAGSLGDLCYDLTLTDPANDPQTPVNLIQEAMLQEESRYASEFGTEPNLMVVRDGPLLYQPYRSPDLAIGYVKTMGRCYLQGEKAEILWQLRPGQRTPIFALGEAGSPKRRWSWYLRSGDDQLNLQNLGYHGLHGIVRLDLYGNVPLAQATEIANQTCLLIPEYASTPSRDPRAPQNLTPVGALERDLARLMGNQTLVSRRLQQFLSNVVVFPQL
ncbi:MAG: hypothetical protein ACFBSC_05525 [Microcoleaceae cyanobacterium]